MTPASAELWADLSTSASSMAPSTDNGSSSLLLAAGSVDPTSFLNDVLGGLIGGPAILIIPIASALGVATLIAFLIVQYAQPAASEDDDEMDFEDYDD